MNKSKKGFTLVELMVGVLVLGLAIIAGTQIFNAAASGHSRATRLSLAVEEISGNFDVGAPAPADPATSLFTRVDESTTVTVTINGTAYTDPQSLVRWVYSDPSVNVSTQIFGLKGSYGSGN